MRIVWQQPTVSPLCAHSFLVQTLVSSACTETGIINSSPTALPNDGGHHSCPPLHAHGVMANTAPHLKRQLIFLCDYGLLINSWSFWKHIRRAVNSMAQEVQYNFRLPCSYTQFVVNSTQLTGASSFLVVINTVFLL